MKDYKITFYEEDEAGEIIDSLTKEITITASDYDEANRKAEDIWSKQSNRYYGIWEDDEESDFYA